MGDEFKALTDHLQRLRASLIVEGFSEIERAAILGAEARNWHIDVKAIVELAAPMAQSGPYR